MAKKKKKKNFGSQIWREDGVNDIERTGKSRRDQSSLKKSGEL